MCICHTEFIFAYIQGSQTLASAAVACTCGNLRSLLGNNIDNTGQGIGAVENCAGTANNLDSFNSINGNSVQVTEALHI